MPELVVAFQCLQGLCTLYETEAQIVVRTVTKDSSHITTVFMRTAKTIFFFHFFTIFIHLEISELRMLHSFFSGVFNALSQAKHNSWACSVRLPAYRVFKSGSCCPLSMSYKLHVLPYISRSAVRIFTKFGV